MSCLPHGYSIGPRPGQSGPAPCENPDCGNLACESARAIADAVCWICRAPIGRGVALAFQQLVFAGEPGQTAGLLVSHEACAVNYDRTARSGD